MVFLQDTEWAATADDVLWRRSKLGMYLDPIERAKLARWLAGDAAVARTAA